MRKTMTFIRNLAYESRGRQHIMLKAGLLIAILIIITSGCSGAPIAKAAFSCPPLPGHMHEAKTVSASMGKQDRSLPTVLRWVT